MRIRLTRAITAFIIILNFISVFFIWKLLSGRENLSNGESEPENNDKVKSVLGLPVSRKPELIGRVQNEVTFVIRSFEQFEHDIADTVNSVLTIYPGVTILVITDNPFYPPIILNKTNLVGSVKFVTTKPSLSGTFKDRTPILHIETKYTLFIPDSTRINSKKLLEKLINIISTKNAIIAVPFKAKEVKCLQVHLDIREWFIRFDETQLTTECDFILGKHALFLATDLLLRVSEPFMLPFPDSLYIQFASKYLKVMLTDVLQLNNGRKLFKSHHNQMKAQQAVKERQKSMFQNLQLKKVVRENGVTEWYGCRRDTPRCFASIVDDTPQYLWEGKWTPPCCLAGLRKTARHVFEQLEEAGVRYWLEGGSLMGAMRAGDILPWDYDVDIGIYKEDITRCTWLLRASVKPITDQQGFVWEKAVEGDFYRVQFSQINRLHVDIFPFYSKNGTMTKDTWFKTHQQDTEFPEHYLKPLSTIDFVGRSVSAPNNIHDFLELKFGAGAIESPEYPNPHKMEVHGLPRGPVNS